MASPESIATEGPVPSRAPASSPVGRFRRSLGPASAELALIAVLYLIYRSGRLLVADHTAAAMANAERVRRWEAWLHLPSEALIQSDVFSENIVRMTNVYYVAVHFPIMIAFLLLGYGWRSRAQYQWARTLVVVQTGFALLIHLAFPLAPPRMFALWGFVGTMSVYGPRVRRGSRLGSQPVRRDAQSPHGLGGDHRLRPGPHRPRWLSIPSRIPLVTTFDIA